MTHAEQIEDSLSTWRTRGNIPGSILSCELMLQIILKQFGTIDFQGGLGQIERHQQQAHDPSAVFFAPVLCGFSRPKQQASHQTAGKGACQPFQRTGLDGVTNPQRDIELLFEPLVRLAELEPRCIPTADQCCEFGGCFSWFSHWRSFSNSWQVRGNAQGLLTARMIMDTITARIK